MRRRAWQSHCAVGAAQEGRGGKKVWVLQPGNRLLNLLCVAGKSGGGGIPPVISTGVIMGRKALPTNVHILRGDPSKKGMGALSEEQIRIPIQIPECPSHLDAPARAEWQRITPHLQTAGLVTEFDRASLAAYCQAWSEWMQCERDLKAKKAKHGVGALVDVTPSGYKQVAAAAQVRDRALDRMLRFAKEFGLTPASRIQSTSGQQMVLPGVPDDPMEAFLNAGSAMTSVG